MSNYVKATNFTAKDALPSGNPGKIVKGTEIDVELTAVAAAISSKADTNSPTFTGTPLAPTASSSTNNTQIASTAFVQAVIAATALPTGMIMLWSGSIASIPTGWVLCNGFNGTPDLRNRFVVGAGSSYAVAATGGSKDAIVVSHTHTGTTNTTGAHTHSYTGIGFGTDRGVDSGSVGLGGTSTTGSAGNHSHTFTTDSAGSSGTNANLPPYYALCYIMKS